MTERRSYAWSLLILKLRRTPGRWSLEFPDHPARLVERIRLKQHRALRIEGGHLEARITNQYTPPTRRPRGDIWVRWVDHSTPANEGTDR